MLPRLKKSGVYFSSIAYPATERRASQAWIFASESCCSRVATVVLLLFPGTQKRVCSTGLFFRPES